MRSSHLKIIFGILILLSVFLFNILYQGGICLSCLFSFFIVIFGLIVLITGIVQTVRDLKDSKDGIKDESENVDSSSFLEPLFWTRDATVRIIRNRRRSAQMIFLIIRTVSQVICLILFI